MTRNTRLSARYWSLVKRLGKKKALLALAHTMLRIIYHILSSQTSYMELGPDYVKAKKARNEEALIRLLQARGYQVVKAS